MNKDIGLYIVQFISDIDMVAWSMTCHHMYNLLNHVPYQSWCKVTHGYHDPHIKFKDEHRKRIIRLTSKNLSQLTHVRIRHFIGLSSIHAMIRCENMHLDLSTPSRLECTNVIPSSVKNLKINMVKDDFLMHLTCQYLHKLTLKVSSNHNVQFIMDDHFQIDGQYDTDNQYNILVRLPSTLKIFTFDDDFNFNFTMTHMTKMHLGCASNMNLSNFPHLKILKAVQINARTIFPSQLKKLIIENFWYAQSLPVTLKYLHITSMHCQMDFTSMIQLKTLIIDHSQLIDAQFPASLRVLSIKCKQINIQHLPADLKYFTLQKNYCETKIVMCQWPFELKYIQLNTYECDHFHILPDSVKYLEMHHYTGRLPAQLRILRLHTLTFDHVWPSHLQEIYIEQFDENISHWPSSLKIIHLPQYSHYIDFKNLPHLKSVIYNQQARYLM